MEELGGTILLYLHYFLRPTIIIVGLILGIIIICTKESITKLLGASIVIGSIGNILNAVYEIGMHFVGTNTIGTLIYVQSAVSFVLGLASGVILYLYVKKRYGTKLITGIIMIVGGCTMSTVITMIFNKIFEISDFDNPSQFSYLLSSITFLIGFAFQIAWFIIFFKNRHKEKELKLLWLERVICLASAAVSLGSGLYMFFALSGTPSYAEINSLQMNNDVFQIIGTLVFCVLDLLMKIYIVVKGRKASKDIEPAIAEE